MRGLFSALLLSGSLALASVSVVGVPALPATAVNAVAPVAEQMQALTAGGGLDGFGAFSPDGQQVAFMRDGKIHLIGVGGKEVRTLTQDRRHWDAAPIWRPDGQELAFVRLSRQSGEGMVMLTDLKGQRLRPLATVKDPVGYLAYAADGKSIYFSTPRQILHADLSSGKQRLLMEVSDAEEVLSGGLSVSKDGQRLIFGKAKRDGRNAIYDLYELPLGGGSERRLTEDGGLMPTIAPDGSFVVFRNPRRPDSGIYRLDFKSGKQTKLVADEAKAMYFHPAISPDGSQLVISRLTVNGQGRGMKFNSQLYLHRLKR